MESEQVGTRSAESHFTQPPTCSLPTPHCTHSTADTARTAHTALSVGVIHRDALLASFPALMSSSSVPSPSSVNARDVGRAVHPSYQ